MKTVFFGTSSHSAQFLDLAVKNGLKFDLVVAAPAKPTGRRQILAENPTVAMAKQHQISYLTSLAELLKQSNEITIGLMLDFNQIVPKEIIDLFPKGIINIHFSKLPADRGPAPVPATILNGDKVAWISYFLITEKLDEGPILTQTSLPLTGREDTQTLYEKLIGKASGEIKKIIDDYLAGKIIPQPQKGEPTWTQKLTTEKARIDWTKPPIEIDRLIRAAYPEPGAWTEVTADRLQTTDYGKKRLKILKAHLENGKLIPDLLHLEGKKPVTWKQFLEGHPGACFASKV